MEVAMGVSSWRQGVGRGPPGFSYIILIEWRGLTGAIFWSCFFRCPPENFSADALGGRLT